MNKTTKLITTVMFVFACITAWALPGTGVANLQTTPGVTTSASGSTLNITAPNKSILVWQNFGSGVDSIALGEAVNYALPSNSSSVLNIVSGNSRTTIDGSIASNGNVFVLNPNGIVIGGGARIDVNSLYLSTSDNTALAGFYFQNNGKLPSQDSAVLANGTTTIAGGAVIAVTENITIASKNVDVGAFISQGNLNINADGNVVVGSSGTTYITGNVSITNPTGVTTLGAAGSTFIASNNLVVNSTSGTVTNTNTSNLNARSFYVNAGTGDVTIGKVMSNNVTVTGNNINVAVAASGAVNLAATGNGTVSVSAPGTLNVASLKNTGAGTTTIVAGGAVTLGDVRINSGGNTSFTGTSITDSQAGLFVYGPTSFTATGGGDVLITRGNHSFGPVSVNTTGNATVYENGALNLNVINAAKFNAQTAEFVFQTPTTGVLTTPAANIIATGNVTLGAATNAIGTVAVRGNNIAIVNTGAVTLGNVTASGSLTVTSTSTIGQATDTKVTSFGNTSFTGTGLTLTNAGNQFGAITADVTATGSVSLTEDTTLNLVSLRAANATIKSLSNVITTNGGSNVAADTFNIIAGGDFTPASNLRTVNNLTVLAGGKVDLSLLSLVNNLNNKTPTVIATGYVAPAP